MWKWLDNILDNITYRIIFWLTLKKDHYPKLERINIYTMDIKVESLDKTKNKKRNIRKLKKLFFKY